MRQPQHASCEANAIDLWTQRAARAVVLIVAALILTGCSRPIDTAVHVANGSATLLRATHDTLEEVHRHERDRAVDLAEDAPHARVAARDVHIRFRPAWEAYDAARTAWVVGAAAIATAEAVDAGGGDPDFEAIANALIQLAKATEQMGAAVDRAARPIAPPPKPASPFPAKPVPLSVICLPSKAVAA